MVQHYQSPVRVYRYPFELVMAAYERRFPNCPQIPVVLDCEIIYDNWNEDRSRRETIRKCKLAVEVPYLLKKMIGVDVVYFIQTNVLDLKSRYLIIDAVNESFANRVGVIEKCRYYVHPENPSWTCFDQIASLDIKNFFGFENAMEKLAMKQYSQNIAKGKELIEYFVGELKKESITYVEPWSAPAEEGNCSIVSSVYSNNSSTSGINEDLLNADYIKKWFCHLSPLEESQLLQFKKAMLTDNIEMSHDWFTLLRFLRARNFDIQSAKEMLQSTISWRKENNVDHLKHTYRMHPVLVNYFPGGWHSTDIDGRPLYVLRLGQMDVKGLIKSVGGDELLNLTLHICEEGLTRIEQSSHHVGRIICGWCLLVDLEGLNMRHLWRPGIRTLLRIIETVEANYPDTMGRVVIVRAPRVFPILWTLVSTFIDENTRSKFILFSAGDGMEGLTSLIPETSVPDFLGGSSKMEIHNGGLVPKSLYISGPVSDVECETGLSTSPEHHSLYHAVQLSSGQIHEVFLKNVDPRSVLTWDFDIMGEPVYFTVYRTNQHIEENSNRSSIFDTKNWKEGQEYYSVEKTIVCKDGESVQGSHIMTHCGTYIMQWRQEEGNKQYGGTAKLMYYHEILSSSDYRGSMTSLQSTFSAISINSSCSSR